MWAFVFRDFHLNRRYLNWVLVFTFYAVVNAATIALIGVATNNPKLLLNLVLGVVLWSYLAAMFSEIAQSISWERWEGTLEYTFMAPVSRLVHLTGVSISATGYALVRVVLVVLGLLVIVPFQPARREPAGSVVRYDSGEFGVHGAGVDGGGAAGYESRARRPRHEHIPGPDAAGVGHILSCQRAAEVAAARFRFSPPRPTHCAHAGSCWEWITRDYRRRAT